MPWTLSSQRGTQPPWGRESTNSVSGKTGAIQQAGDAMTLPLSLSALLLTQLAGGQPGLQVTREVLTPKVVVIPAYPDARLAGLDQGEITARLEVRPDGTVEGVVIEGESLVLREAAKQAALRWRFEQSTDERRTTVAVFSFGYQGAVGEAADAASRFVAPNRVEVFAYPRRVSIIEDPVVHP